MSNKDRYWAKTKNLLFVTLAIWFVFSIGIFLFGTEMEASSFRPLGYPLSYYMTCQGSLGIFVILTFWFAGRQEKIDDEFGYSEREED
jgi:putative solute:sodium symporter small subunit